MGRVIVASLLFVLASSAMLAAGILSGIDQLVVGSIGLSVIAAVLLFVAIRGEKRSRSEPEPAKPAISARENTAITDAAVLADNRPVASSPDILRQPKVRSTESSGLDDATVVLPRLDPLPKISHGARSVPLGESVVPPLLPNIAETTATTVREPVTSQVSSPVGDPPSPPDSAQPASSNLETPAEPSSEEVEDQVPPEQLDEEYDDPPDEPPAELLLSSEENRISEMSFDVMVVDGRPRYHVTGCAHLADKASQPLPVSEATELGFTPCSACSAATTLLAAAP